MSAALPPPGTAPAFPVAETVAGPPADALARTTRRAARQRSLVGAEVLKLRRRRMIVITTSLLTIGLVVIVGGIIELVHVSDPARFGPAGGLDTFGALSDILAALCAVAGIIVGASAGSMDLGAGVFRSLVVTGRPRISLFLARVPAVLILVLPFLVVADAIVAGGAVGLAGDKPVPGVALMVRGGLWVVLSVSVWSLLALGFSSLVGSRSIAIGVLLACEFIISGILSSLSGLPWLRQAFVGVTLHQILPAALQQGSTTIRIETGWQAAIVICCWVVGMLGLGAWRTVRRDA